MADRPGHPVKDPEWLFERKLDGEVVAFRGEETSFGLLRQPRFEGLRDDKDPAEVVRETPAQAGPEGSA